MDTKQYFTDVVISNCNDEICEKLKQSGFVFRNNRMTNSMKEYSVSQIDYRTENGKNVKLVLSEYDEKYEMWNDLDGYFIIKSDEIFYIDKDEKKTSLNSKEDLFNVTLINSISITFDMLEHLQGLIKYIKKSSFYTLIIFYGVGEEKEYGY